MRIGVLERNNVPGAGWAAAAPDVRWVIRLPRELVPGWGPCVPLGTETQAGAVPQSVLLFAAPSRDSLPRPPSPLGFSGLLP